MQRFSETSLPVLKQELLDEESPCNEFMTLSEPEQYVNYYDSEFEVKTMKLETPEDTFTQAYCSLKNKLVFEDSEILDDNWELVKNNIDETLFINKKVKKEILKHQVSIKTERLKDEEILKSGEDVSIHYDILTNTEQVQCKLCGTVFGNRLNLLKHNIKHMKLNVSLHKKLDELQNVNDEKLKINDNNKTQTNVLECQSCGKVFKKISILALHVKKVHSNEKFPCQFCTAIFRNKYYLKGHVTSVHADDEEFKCEICHKLFKYKPYLTKHMKKTHSDERYKCDHCGSFCKSKYSLWQHIRIVHYNRVEKYKCKFCEAAYTTKNILTRHVKSVHSVNLKFKCELCKMVYKTKSALSLHIKCVHSNKAIQCKICETVLKHKYYLTGHLRTVHSSKNYKCAPCNMDFTTEGRLILHSKNIHDNGKYRCYSCKASFVKKLKLTQHLHKCTTLKL